MTGDRLKEIRGRLQGITEGPWLDDDIRTVYGPKYPVCQVMGAASSGYDLKFIAHARQDIPDLLAALDEARELLKEVRGWHITKSVDSCEAEFRCDLCKRIAARVKMNKQSKTRTVLVKCMVVDTDGDPVDRHGEPIAGTRKKPWYSWEKRSKTHAWLNKYPDQWLPVTMKAKP